MKKIKVALSLILAIMLTSIMVLPALAASTQCDCGHAPVIQVRGIGETLYDAEGNEIFSTENIINGILPVMPQLAQFLLDTTQTGLFVDAAETAVKSIFGPVMYDKNGARLVKDAEGKDTVITVNCDNRPVEQYMDFDKQLSEEGKLSKALYEELGDNHVYYFTYDWTGNPVEIVKQLKTFIDNVKKTSGHNKVSINAESMGGAVVSLYINTYGYDSIENLVMANSAFNGLEMMGQLFMGHPQIDGEALAFLLAQEILSNPELGELVAYIPVFEQLALMANDIMLAEHDAIYSRIFVPVFAYMPSFWMLVPTYNFVAEDGNTYNTFDVAKDVMFGVNTSAFSETRANAGSKLLSIVNEVASASKRTTTMVKAMTGYTYELDLGAFGKHEVVVEPKINFYANVTNYNSFIAPVTPSANWNSDGVIEAFNASGFATVADMGYNLGENYIQAQLKDVANYVSPDNVIDASTCQAPDNTWFIKNLGHVKYGLDDGTADFYVWLLTATEEYTINTNAEYPQFMYYDTDIPELMTFAEKEEMENNNGGIAFPELPGLPDIDLDGLEGALDQIIGGLGDMGFDIGDLGDINIGELVGNIDLSALTGLLGSLGGVVGGLGDLLGGLLGGGSGGETPAPTPDEDEGLGEEFGDGDNLGENEAPSGDVNSDNNGSHVGSDNVVNPVNPDGDSGNSNSGNSNSGNSNQGKDTNKDKDSSTSSGLIISGEPIFSSGNSTWIILFALAALVAGILVIKL